MFSCQGLLKNILQYVTTYNSCSEKDLKDIFRNRENHENAEVNFSTSIFQVTISKCCKSVYTPLLLILYIVPWS